MTRGPKVYYRGRRGYTTACEHAVVKTLATHRLREAILVTYEDCGMLTHGWVLVHATDSRRGYRRRKLTVVADGFASGYSGAGPWGLVDSLGRLVAAGVYLRGVRLGRNLAGDLFERRLTLDQIQRYVVDEAGQLFGSWVPGQEARVTVEHLGTCTFVNLRSGSQPQQIALLGRFATVQPAQETPAPTGYTELHPELGGDRRPGP